MTSLYPPAKVSKFVPKNCQVHSGDHRITLSHISPPNWRKSGEKIYDRVHFLGKSREKIYDRVHFSGPRPSSIRVALGPEIACARESLRFLPPLEIFPVPPKLDGLFRKLPHPHLPENSIPPPGLPTRLHSSRPPVDRFPDGRPTSPLLPGPSHFPTRRYIFLEKYIKNKKFY